MGLVKLPFSAVFLTERSFHCLQATWQPRQPIHLVRSISTPFGLSFAMSTSYIFSTLTIKAFVSGIIVFASPMVGVRRLELSPPLPSAGCCHPKHHGSPTWCTVLPSTLNGLNLLVTTAMAQTSPRADVTFTFWPFFIPFSFASSSLISTNCCGIISKSHGTCLVITPVCQCSETR